MKHIEIYEKYDIDTEGDIADEYVKSIFSHYIDNLEKGGTLQDSFDFYCKEDLDEDLRQHVYHQLLHFLQITRNKLVTLGFSDDFYLRRDSKKYNL